MQYLVPQQVLNTHISLWDASIFIFFHFLETGTDVIFTSFYWTLKKMFRYHRKFSYCIWNNLSKNRLKTVDIVKMSGLCALVQWVAVDEFYDHKQLATSTYIFIYSMNLFLVFAYFFDDRKYANWSVGGIHHIDHFAFQAYTSVITDYYPNSYYDIDTW